LDFVGRAILPAAGFQPALAKIGRPTSKRRVDVVLIVAAESIFGVVQVALRKRREKR
jgi:hypothetical protein